MINKVIITGRLTKGVELRRTNDGTPYTFFTVAVNRPGQDKVDFINCSAWRQTAELMNQYLNKGSMIGLEGSVQSWTKQNKEGINESAMTIVATKITFLDSKRAENTTSTEPQQIPVNTEQDVNLDEIKF